MIEQIDAIRNELRSVGVVNEQIDILLDQIIKQFNTLEKKYKIAMSLVDEIDLNKLIEKFAKGE